MQLKKVLLVSVVSLIKAGADVNIKRLDGNTALMRAVDAGYKDCASVLIKSGGRCETLELILR